MRRILLPALAGMLAACSTAAESTVQAPVAQAPPAAPGTPAAAAPAAPAATGGAVPATPSAEAAPAAAKAAEEAADGERPPETKPAETDDQVLERITGEMMRRIEELRGLRFRHDVKRVWKSREEAKAEMLAEIEKQAEKEDLASASKAFAFFGLVKEGADLKAIFADFIAAAAGGYYLPDTKTFSLVRGFKEDGSRPIVFHELVHAVEDQYYDWQARSEEYRDQDRSDPGEALHAVVEGSARMFENRFVDSEPGLKAKYMAVQMEESMKQMGAVLKAPPALVISVAMFPYENGSRFLGEVLPALTAGEEPVSEVEAIARIYADPPMSTEQILHPEKYLGARDLPREIRLPDGAAVLGEGWKELMKDTMGELSAGLVLNASLKQNFLPMQVQEVQGPGGSVQFKGDTATAVGGWDGDRYALYEKGDSLCLAWLTAWDRPEDAKEFADTYEKVLTRKYGTVQEVEVDGKTKKRRVPPPSAPMACGDWTGTRWTGTRDGDTAILVRGDRLLLLERVPADRIEKLAEAIAEAEVVQDPKDSLPAPAK